MHRSAPRGAHGAVSLLPRFPVSGAAPAVNNHSSHPVMCMEIAHLNAVCRNIPENPKDWRLLSLSQPLQGSIREHQGLCKPHC